MIDLWQLLVEQVFQSFWGSIVGLSMIMFVMFMFFKVSPATSGYFIAVFWFAMCIGYGYMWLAMLIWITLIVISIGAGTKLINSMGIGG